MKPKLIVSFQRLPEPEFQTKMGHIIAKLTGNTHYPEPWAAQVGSLAQLNDALMVYRANYTDSTTRDTMKIKARQEARDVLTHQIQTLAPYLEMLAQDDVKILESTGYDLRSESRGPGARESLRAPGNLRVSHGRLSGTLLLRVARLSGAASYEVSTTTGDPMASTGWKHALTSASGARMVIDGLTPGQSVWVRVRAVNMSGSGLWTQPINMMVV